VYMADALFEVRYGAQYKPTDRSVNEFFAVEQKRAGRTRLLSFSGSDANRQSSAVKHARATIFRFVSGLEGRRCGASGTMSALFFTLSRMKTALSRLAAGAALIASLTVAGPSFADQSSVAWVTSWATALQSIPPLKAPPPL
jgi:hypothetical protein